MPKEKNSRVVTIATKITVQEKEELDIYCQEYDMTIAQILRAALKQYLNK